MAKSGFAKEELKGFADRLFKIDEEKERLGNDRREVLVEVKGAGLDTKTLNKVVARMRLDRSERQEADAIQDMYESSLGMK